MAGLSRSGRMETHSFVSNLKLFVLPTTSATSSVHRTTRNRMVMQKVLLRTSSISWKKPNLQTSHQPSLHGKTQDGPNSPVPTNYFLDGSWESSCHSCVPLFVRLPQSHALPLMTHPGSGPFLLYLLDGPSGYKTRTPNAGQWKLLSSPPAAQVAPTLSRRKKPKPSLATGGSLGHDTCSTVNILIRIHFTLCVLYIFVYKLRGGDVRFISGMSKVRPAGRMRPVNVFNAAREMIFSYVMHAAHEMILANITKFFWCRFFSGPRENRFTPCGPWAEMSLTPLVYIISIFSHL